MYFDLQKSQNKVFSKKLLCPFADIKIHFELWRSTILHFEDFIFLFREYQKSFLRICRIWQDMKILSLGYKKYLLRIWNYILELSVQTKVPFYFNCTTANFTYTTTYTYLSYGFNCDVEIIRFCLKKQDIGIEFSIWIVEVYFTTIFFIWYFKCLNHNNCRKIYFMRWKSIIA